ncbi:hypothetical protein V2A60_008823 [Cordyceps javanica]
MSVPRSELIHRKIPRMQMGDGTVFSKTAVPGSAPAGMSSADRARARFAVTGNAIVAGGAGDIGLVACRALLEHGLEGLAILDLSSQATGDAAAAGLQADFPAATVIFRRVDVTDADAVSDAVNQAVRALGRITVCCCFAGIVGAEDAIALEAAQFRAMLDVNATGTFLVAQAAARAMVSLPEAEFGGGSIILTASISGHIVNYPQSQAHYNAAKAAVLSMKSSLAAEWGQYGIRVNSISPGYMDTILNKGDGLAEHRKAWAERTPWGRMGDPEELTGAVVLLASRAGSYITGADIIVDGGVSVF